MRAYIQRRVFNSSYKAEAFAMYDGIDVAKSLIALAREMCLPAGEVTATAWTDAMDVVRALHHPSPSSVEVSSVTLLHVLQDMIKGSACLRPLPIKQSERSDVVDDANSPMPDEVRNTPVGPAPGDWVVKEATSLLTHVMAMKGMICDTRLQLRHLSGINCIADHLTKSNAIFDVTHVLEHPKRTFIDGERGDGTNQEQKGRYAGVRGRDLEALRDDTGNESKGVVMLSSPTSSPQEEGHTQGETDVKQDNGNTQGTTMLSQLFKAFSNRQRPLQERVQR